MLQGVTHTPAHTSPSLLNTILLGDAFSVLKRLPDDFVDMIITSPPYWNLRDYGMANQLGQEPTVERYIQRLCDIFDEAKRVLKKSGTCWVNLSDTYAGSGKGYGNLDHGKLGKHAHTFLPRPQKTSLPDKSLCLVPSRFAIEMVNRGWLLRNTVIWQKPNCMPASVKDRFTVDFEYLFFFVKSKKYYFAQQFEPQKDWGVRDRSNGKYKQAGLANGLSGRLNPQGRNKRCVWQVTTKGFPNAHFAVYPEKLLETPILAGCPEGGIVLDPFIGSGTSALVAKKLRRNYLGIEINPAYIQMARERLRKAMLTSRA